eukprot:6605846-Pyramimonas_sp.AAC.1
MTDFDVSARLAAALLGTRRADPTEFAEKGRASTSAYAPRWRQTGPLFRAAVSDALAREFPSVPALLRGAAVAPGSKVELYTPKKLHKKAAELRRTPRAEGGRRPVEGRGVVVFGTTEDRADAKAKHRALYKTIDEYLQVAAVQK